MRDNGSQDVVDDLTLDQTDLMTWSGSGAPRESVAQFAARLGHAVSGLTEEVLQEFVQRIDDAGRVLVVPPVNESSRDELIHTSRAALMLVTEALVTRRGDRGRDARAAALHELGSAIQE